MSHPEIRWTAPEDENVWQGTRIVVRLGGDLVAIVSLSDLHTLESLESGGPRRADPEARWETEGGAPRESVLRTRDTTSLLDLVDRLDSLGIDPGTVAVPPGMAIRAEMGGEARVEVSEPRHAPPDFSRDDD